MMENSSENRSLSWSWTQRIRVFLSSGEHWTQYHLRIFLLTFFSYALMHASRKTLSTTKASLIEKWVVTKIGNKTGSGLFHDKDEAEDFLGDLDGGFLTAYAIVLYQLGLYISGMLGDRFEPRLVLAIGMCLSSLMVFLFGTLPEWLPLLSNKLFYMTTWVLCGLVQSSGWPTEVAIMGSWFGHHTRGAVLGLWSGCASLGNIFGTLVTAGVINYGFEYAFLVNACLLFIGGCIVFFLLVSAPRDVGLPNPSESPMETSVISDGNRPKPISFIRALFLPGVISYSLSYACLKLVNYGFFFWLPLYLHNNFSWPESVADQLSTYYDWGGLVAGFLAGLLTDHLSSRTPVVIMMLLISMGALFGYSKSPRNLLINGILMTITGFFIGGPANLISAAISADLAKCPEIYGSSEALSTVTGIVDGTGSIGAALGQFFVPLIRSSFGWNSVFYFFILMIFGTCLCLLSLLYKEMRSGTVPLYRIISTEDSVDTEEN